MGCCTRFRRTWRPGYGLDAIDPNKVFDFERRLIIAKKVVIIFISIILLVSLIYFMVYLLSTNNEENASSSSTVTSDGNNTVSVTSTNDSVKSGSLFHFLTSTRENITSHNSSELSLINDTNINNNSVISPGSIDENDTESILLETVLSASDSGNNNVTWSTPPPLFLGINNITYDKRQNDSNFSCLSTGTLRECIALSKSFKNVTTFWNLTRFDTNKFQVFFNKYNGSVEGYVMLKMRGIMWYPFCHANWTLEMGYSLCNGLGFQQLSQLQTIDIHQLTPRVSHKLGKYVSFRTEGLISQPEELSVITTEGSVRRLKPKSTKIKCEVGYISCY